MYRQLRPRHMRPVHLRPHSYETFSFETTFVWADIRLRPQSFETTFTNLFAIYKNTKLFAFIKTRIYCTYKKTNLYKNTNLFAYMNIFAKSICHL